MGLAFEKAKSPQGATLSRKVVGQSGGDVWHCQSGPLNEGNIVLPRSQPSSDPPHAEEAAADIVAAVSPENRSRDRAATCVLGPCNEHRAQDFYHEIAFHVNCSPVAVDPVTYQLLQGAAPICPQVSVWHKVLTDAECLEACVPLPREETRSSPAVLLAASGPRHAHGRSGWLSGRPQRRS